MIRTTKAFTVAEIFLEVIFLIAWTLFYYFVVNANYKVVYDPLANDISIWNDTFILIIWGIGISILVILPMEYYGIHIKKFGIIIFSCVYRFLQVLGVMGILIYLIIVIAIQNKAYETLETSIG